MNISIEMEFLNTGMSLNVYIYVVIHKKNKMLSL